MLCRDLYDRPLSSALSGHAFLLPAHTIAVEIEALEARVRAGFVPEIRQAARLAIQLDVLLRALPDT